MKTTVLSTTFQNTSGKFLAALCVTLFAAVPLAFGQTTWQNPDLVNGGDWVTPGNWTSGVPTGSTVTLIDNSGLAIINGGTAATRELTVGSTTTGNRLEILGADFTTRGVTLGGGDGSSGSVRLAAGTNWTTDGGGSFSAFLLGSAGSGSLLIESGATLHSGRTRIAIGAGTGEATVRGTWIWESNQSVGLSTSNATLNLGAGGLVSLTGPTQAVSLVGTLNIGGKTTAESAGRLNAASLVGAGSAANLNFNHTDTNYVFETETNTAIAIEGTTKVNQISGTTLLTGANTSTGATSILGGSLLVNGSLSASSAVSVSAAGTLGGVGSVGNVVVDGTLAPGSNGLGTLSTGNIDLTSTGTLHIELGMQTGNPVSDLVAVTGTFSLDTEANLQLALGSGLDTPSAGSLFFLVNNDGTDAINGVFGQLNGVATVLDEGSSFFWNSQEFQITYLADFGSGTFAGGNDIALMAIPEPSSFILLGLGVSGLFLRRRR